MNELNKIVNELKRLLNEFKEFVLSYLPTVKDLWTLYSELIIALLAATVLGWFIGTMIQRGRAKRLLKASESSWEKKYSTLEKTARADSDAFEEQLEAIVAESKSVQATNKALAESLKKNDTSIQKARAEAIELNRQQAETQERLQRIIQQKDSEILRLVNRSDRSASKTVSNRSTPKTPQAAIVSNNNFKDINESELNHADTIAINSAPSAEGFDATVQLNDEIPVTATASRDEKSASEELEISMDDTANLADLSNADILQESTSVLDDDALSAAQRSYPTRKRD